MRPDPEHVAHYRLIEPLGQGGMGMVYRAEDTRLGRHVALKLLPPAALADPRTRERFLNEARAAAVLEHPNICTLFEFGDADGQPYIAMQLVDGETLRGRIERGALEEDAARRVLTAIAAALAAAHARGILHRDVKSDNVLLGRDGAIKLADFGVARLAEAAGLTATSTTVGTLSYLSPEQLRGEPASPASDQFALGVMAYECVTGSLPFAGDHPAAVLFAIANLEPEAPSVRRPGLDPAWDALIARALAKQPGDRFPSVEAFGAAVTAMADGAAPAAPDGATRPISSVLPLPPGGGPALPSLAVLYFENLSSDAEDEYFCAGITEDILTDLSRVPGMLVASRNGVARYRGQVVDARKVAGELGVGAVLTGSVRRAGNRVRISAELLDAALGFPKWAERYDRVLDDVFAVQEDIAGAIATALRGALSPDEAAAIRRDRPAQVEAYDLYLKGRHLYERYTSADNQRALECFEEAVAVDPRYALAWAGIADCCAQMHDKGWDTHPAVQSRGFEAAARSIELDPTLAEGHKAEALLWRTRRDHARAVTSLRRALEANPRFLPALMNLAQEFLSEGDFAAAERALRRAVAADPAYGFGHLLLAFLLFYTRRFDDALAESHRAQRFGESPFFASYAYALRAHVHAERGDLAAARLELEGGRAADAPEPIMNAAAALIAARSGADAEADALLAALGARPPAESYGCELAAAAAARRGDVAGAVAFLRAAERIDQRHWSYWRLSPDYEALRGTPAFEDCIGARGRSLVWPEQAPPLADEERARFESFATASGVPGDRPTTADVAIPEARG